MSNVKELLDAGVHFGHQTRRWNPKMREFIFEARNGIHIIDLVQTVSQIETAAQFLTGIVSKGGKVLIVGTKKQAQATIKETAEATGQPYVCERWLGGMMTNLNTIKRSIKRMLELETMESDGRMAEFVMQEQSMLRRELSRLHIRLNGIRDLSAKPDAIIIIDIKREHNALAEAPDCACRSSPSSTPTLTLRWSNTRSPATTTPSAQSRSCSVRSRSR